MLSDAFDLELFAIPSHIHGGQGQPPYFLPHIHSSLHFLPQVVATLLGPPRPGPHSSFGAHPSRCPVAPTEGHALSLDLLSPPALPALPLDFPSFSISQQESPGFPLVLYYGSPPQVTRRSLSLSSSSRRHLGPSFADPMAALGMPSWDAQLCALQARTSEK